MRSKIAIAIISCNYEIIANIRNTFAIVRNTVAIRRNNVSDERL